MKTLTDGASGTNSNGSWTKPSIEPKETINSEASWFNTTSQNMTINMDIQKQQMWRRCWVAKGAIQHHAMPQLENT